MWAHTGQLGRGRTVSTSELTHTAQVSPHNQFLLLHGGFQIVDAVGQILDPACGVDVEPIEDLHGVVVGVLGSDIAGHALHILADHDHRQQYQLKERLGNPAMMPSPPGFNAGGSPIRAIIANT